QQVLRLIDPEERDPFRKSLAEHLRVVRVAHALPHHEYAAPLLPPEQKASEIGMSEVKRAEQCRFSRSENLSKSRRIRREIAPVRETAGDTKAEHQELLESEKMTEDFAQRWLTPADRPQIFARVRALGRHGGESKPSPEHPRRSKQKL